MKRTILLSMTLLALAAPSVLSARTSGELQITEQTLNAVVEKIGVQSDSGVHQILIDIAGTSYDFCDSLGTLLCPPFGPALPEGPVPRDLVACWSIGGDMSFFPSNTVAFRWWVADAHFTMQDGSMTFTATVGSDVGGNIAFTRRTVPATLRLNAAGDRLKVGIENFEVDIVAEGYTRPIEIVDLDALYGVSLTFDTLDIELPESAGGAGKTVTATVNRVEGSESGVIVEYGAGYVLVKLDVTFTEAES